MIHLDTLSTLVAATLVLLLGRKLVHSVSLLKKYTIPEPVAGGLLVALALLLLKKSMGWEIDFDMSRLHFRAVTEPGPRGASCSSSAMGLKTRRKWRWPVRPLAWCWVA